MSCVAAEKPSSTAAMAMAANCCGFCGSMLPMAIMATTTSTCAKNSQARRLPSTREKYGSGRLSISGAHTNLNE